MTPTRRSAVGAGLLWAETVLSAGSVPLHNAATFGLSALFDFARDSIAARGLVAGVGTATWA